MGRLTPTALPSQLVSGDLEPLLPRTLPGRQHTSTGTRALRAASCRMATINLDYVRRAKEYLRLAGSERDTLIAECLGRLAELYADEAQGPETCSQRQGVR